LTKLGLLNVDSKIFSYRILYDHCEGQLFLDIFSKTCQISLSQFRVPLSVRRFFQIVFFSLNFINCGFCRQVHRHARALRRIVHFLAEVRVRTNTLGFFLVPIVKAFLLDKAYTKQTDLVDAAVEAMSAIARELPWSHYSRTLLLLLEDLGKEENNNKLTVRYVVQKTTAETVSCFFWSIYHVVCSVVLNTSI